MALQPTGQIALSDIMRETSMSNKTDYSLDNGENGQTNIGYPRINLCSPLRPSDNDGCSLSEWWGYDHYITCNTYRWTAVYNDTNSSLCTVFPTNTPDDTPTPSGCIETYPNSASWCICQGMDPQNATVLGNNYDGLSDKLVFRNYYNNVFNLKVYNAIGQELYSQPANTVYTNGSFSFSGYSSALYLISYSYFCGGSIGSFNCEKIITNSDLRNKISYGGNYSIGTHTSTGALYSQDVSTNVVCNTTNQIRWIYYNTASTTSSAAVNSVFYLDSSYTILAPAGAYAMANGYKFIVNSSGIVTSVTATCTPDPGLFGRYFRRASLKFFYKTNVSIQIGNCYLFENYTNPSTSYVRGIVSAYNGSTGEVTIINYSGG